jgi:hypothetical protein
MTTRLTVLLLFAIAAAFVGCDSAENGGDTASLRVLLTDAPGDFLHAVVTVDQVYLQAGNGDDDPERGRTILRDEPVTVDLLTLQNEVLALVDDQAIPEGTYHQLRLVISGGYIEVEDEDGGSTIYASSDAYAAEQGVASDGRLQMPSYATSGLKVQLPSDLAEIDGDQTIVLIDFDVAESFGRAAGNSGMWVMRPVVRATDLAFTGGADVTLLLADDLDLPAGLTLADFSAELDKDGETLSVPFADADGDGFYAVDFLYLVPGTYPVTVAAPEGLTITTDVALPFDLPILSGASGDMTVTITSVVEE